MSDSALEVDHGRILGQALFPVGIPRWYEVHACGIAAVPGSLPTPVRTDISHVHGCPSMIVPLPNAEMILSV